MFKLIVMNILCMVGLAIGCPPLYAQEQHRSPVEAISPRKRIKNIWSGPMSAEIAELIVQEQRNKQYKLFVSQYDNASVSIKSSELVQYWRASTQCMYDVPSGLRFVRDTLRQSGKRNERLTAACCGLVRYKGKFPRDQRIAFDICDEYAKVTVFPSQAMSFRALVESQCGNKRKSLILLEKAKHLWESESHIDLQSNPPIDPLFSIVDASTVNRDNHHSLSKSLYGSQISRLRETTQLRHGANPSSKLSLAAQHSGPADRFAGYYENATADMVLRLNPEGYSLEIGRPISVPFNKRHVDFEDGYCTFSKDYISMERVTLFHSPTRSPYSILMGGGMHRGYQREFKTEQEQDKFLGELKWRLVKGPNKRKASIRTVKGNYQIIIDGVVLRLTTPWL